MKKTTLVLALIFATGAVFAQKRTTSSATVTFDATTPKDALPKAENKTVIASFDPKTGAVAFEAAVKNFAFSNPKMQEHFNSANWMNSDQYSKFTFTGIVEKVSKVKLTKNGTYEVKVNGTLTIKDISKPLKANARLTVKDGKLSVVSNFSIKLSDYNITGQPVESGKVLKEPKVTVTAQF
ncbi:MAG TPA: YceI family protein [Chitinophagaceae bacterium]|nr:YceI family protein [Chitinophagaceae bacterium]